MSTNYYLRTADTPADDDGIHLGKYTQGYPFMFRGYPERGITSYGAWYEMAKSGQIVTEAGTPIIVDELEDVIDNARRDWGMRPQRMHRDQVEDANGNRFTLTEFC